MNQDRKVIECDCSCRSGLSGSCKHVFALIYWVNHEPDNSVTGAAQSHGRPSKTSAHSDANKAIDQLIKEKEPSNIKMIDLGPVFGQHLANCDSSFAEVWRLTNNKDQRQEFLYNTFIFSNERRQIVDQPGNDRDDLLHVRQHAVVQTVT